MTKVRKQSKQATHQAMGASLGRHTFDTLRVEIEQLQAAHPDRAIVLIETPPNVGASSVGRGPQERKSLLQNISVDAKGTIWFNVVPGARGGSVGTWSAATMRLDVSELARVELPGFVPEYMRVTEV